MLGFNGMTLFPGLDGVGKHIERIYRIDYQKNLGGYLILAVILRP